MDFAREQGKLWYLLWLTLGMVSMDLELGPEYLEMGGWAETIQITEF